MVVVFVFRGKHDYVSVARQRHVGLPYALVYRRGEFLGLPSLVGFHSRHQFSVLEEYQRCSVGAYRFHSLVARQARELLHLYAFVPHAFAFGAVEYVLGRLSGSGASFVPAAEVDEVAVGRNHRSVFVVVGVYAAHRHWHNLRVLLGFECGEQRVHFLRLLFEVRQVAFCRCCGLSPVAAFDFSAYDVLDEEESLVIRRGVFYEFGEVFVLQFEPLLGELYVLRLHFCHSRHLVLFVEISDGFYRSVSGIDVVEQCIDLAFYRRASAGVEQFCRLVDVP